MSMSVIPLITQPLQIYDFGSDDTSVGTSAELFDKPVLGIGDECRVKGSVRALALKREQGWEVKVAMKEATVLANAIKTFHDQT